MFQLIPVVNVMFAQDAAHAKPQAATTAPSDLLAGPSVDDHNTAAKTIVQRLQTVALDETLWSKRFHDYGQA